MGKIRLVGAGRDAPAAPTGTRGERCKGEPYRVRDGSASSVERDASGIDGRPDRTHGS